MLKVLKFEIYENFEPLIEHGSHWINFLIIFSFISENIDILNAYIKFGTKLFLLTCEKKEKFKTCHGKSEKIVNLNVLEMSP
jgi:hypothetical protein